MSSPTQNPSLDEAARADAVAQVLALDGVAAVFPPTSAVVRSLATRTAAPHESLRVARPGGRFEARIDIGVEAGHRATDVAVAVQELVHRVFGGHGVELDCVAVTVLEHGAGRNP